MKFFLVLLAIALVEFSSAAENACIDVEKYEADKTHKFLDDASAGTLNLFCALFGTEERIKSCKRTVVITFLNKDFQKILFAQYAVNDEAKKKVNSMIDTCFKDRKEYYPCMLKSVKENCPEFADIYKKEVEKSGFDV